MLCDGAMCSYVSVGKQGQHLVRYHANSDEPEGGHSVRFLHPIQPLQ